MGPASRPARRPNQCEPLTPGVRQDAPRGQASPARNPSFPGGLPWPGHPGLQFSGKVFEEAVMRTAMLDTALGSALALALAAGGAVGAAQAPATERPKIEGAWTLNHDIGDRPGRSAGMPDDQGGGGHRHGGYGGGGGGGYGGGMGGMRGGGGGGGQM